MGTLAVTSVALFQQWWDTQNPAEAPGPLPHCNDEVDPVLGTTLNGYPYFCPPAPAESVYRRSATSVPSRVAAFR